MVGGHLCCLSYFFAHSALLLLLPCLHDVEASSCEQTIHKKVGDTVEIPSCLPSEGVTSASWKYKDKEVVDMDVGIVIDPQFTGRVDLNSTNFSLTVRKLTPQDSGVFSFTSEVGNKQRKTIFITLQVHEIITEKPILSVNSTWHASNKSCTVLLDCSATSMVNMVSYKWTARNVTHSGFRLQDIMRTHDGDVEFTCTIFNLVSEKSASTTVKCSNNTSLQNIDFVLNMGLAAGSCLLIVIVVGVVVGVYHCKQRQEGSDSNDLTVYADISDVAIEDRTSASMKPCSMYETINNRVTTVTPGPQTVYDKIQLNRMGNPSVSPYEDII